MITDDQVLDLMREAANALSLTLGEVTYAFSTIDGACDEEISFLRYDYFRDPKQERLVLAVEKPIRLERKHYSLEQAVLQPGSVLVFTIGRPGPVGDDRGLCLSRRSRCRPAGG